MSKSNQISEKDYTVNPICTPTFRLIKSVKTLLRATNNVPRATNNVLRATDNVLRATSYELQLWYFTRN